MSCFARRAHVAGEQSGRNWGWVRIQGRDTREIPMMQDSLATWDGLADALGEDVGFTRGGCFFTARSDTELDALAGWAKLAPDYGLDTRIVYSQELAALVPGGVPGIWRGALYTPSDGRAEPHKAVPALARGVARAGGTVLESCAVRGLETTGGAVSGVVTEHGVIRCSTALCAAGAWTSLFCRSLGVDVPQLTVRGTVARTAAADAGLEGNLFDDTLGIRRREDGGYTVAHGAILEHFVTPASFRYFLKFFAALKQEFRIVRLRFGGEFINALRTPRRWALDRESPFERTRVLNPPPTPKVLRELRQQVDHLFPTLKDVPFVESWAGMIESSPDVVPIIDAIEAPRGLFVATGFSGHGFGIGPGAGRAIAAMLTGETPPVDLGEFRLSRFFDGTPIRPQVTI